jgi:hypothetical protein
MVIVNNKRKSFYRCNDVVFSPGFNEIEEQVLETLLLHPYFRLEIDEDRLVIEKTDFEKLSEFKAIEMIKASCDLNILDNLLKKEKRPKVLEAVNKRIKSFLKAKNKDDQSE